MNMKNESQMSEQYVLLIGVNDYSSNSMGLANLSGPRNDVLVWLEFLNKNLQIPTDNIRVLTSPALNPEDLAKNNLDCNIDCKDVTTENVRDACEWLSARAKGGYGFVFAAGHGEFTGAGKYALYLPEWTGEKMGNKAVVENGQLSLSHLWQQYTGPLTVFADICRSDQPKPGMGWQVDSKLSSPNKTKVVLGASSHGQASYEREYEDGWHGQFTWSAMSILLNWPVGQLPSGAPYVQISPQVLCRGMGKLVRVFNNPAHKQSPTLFTPCPKGPFLFPGVKALVKPYAVVAPSHEIGPGTCDITMGTTVIANCGTSTATAGFHEYRTWKIGYETNANSTAANQFDNALTPPPPPTPPNQDTASWVLKIYDIQGNPQQPTNQPTTFKGGPRDPADAYKTSVDTLNTGYEWKAVVNGDVISRIYVNIWSWGGPPKNNIGISFTVVANQAIDKIPPGTYTFVPCRAVDPMSAPYKGYCWTDNITPQ